MFGIESEINIQCKYDYDIPCPFGSALSCDFCKFKPETEETQEEE